MPHQRIQIAQQPLADRRAVAAHNVIPAPQALLFQPRVQGVKALKARRGHHEVAAAISNVTLNMPLVIPLGRAAKLVVEQIVGLQFSEGSCAVARAVAAYLRNSYGRIVVEHRQWHTAEEGKGRVMAIAKCLGRLRRVSLDEDRVRVRKRHHKVMQLTFNTADHPKRFAKIHLRVPRRVSQRHEDFLRPSLLLPNVIGDDRDATCEPMFIPQAGMDALRSVALLLDLAFVVFQNLVDDRNKWIQLWPRRHLPAPVPGRNRVLQNLRDRLAINPEKPRRLTPAHTINMARTAYPIIKFHRIHLPTRHPSIVASGVKWRNFTPLRPDYPAVSVVQFVSGIHTLGKSRKYIPKNGISKMPSLYI